MKTTMITKKEKTGYLDSPLYTSPYVSQREENEDYYENVQRPLESQRADILFEEYLSNQD